MILPVLIAPDQRLTTPSQEIYEIDEEIETLLDDLYDTMIAHDGIGISACQVGYNLSICVIQLAEEDEILELINPKVLSGEGSSLDLEGCLSLPYFYGTVKRWNKIVVEYYNRDGELMEMTAEGYLARCIQHEVDHLAGILFKEKVIEEIPYTQIEQWMEEHEDD